ncbi:MAG: efflux RND transporter periplasmic adaptor subunit [Alphaproteobacteria bacterium]|nr:efflux RND transporter periplasmic adaptor subunit [Alphaproteobacteria bacterium]
MRKIVLVLVAVLFAVAALAYHVYGRGTAVTVANPERGLAIESVYATGVVEPVTWAQVSALVQGRIAAVRAHDGDRVEEGQLIARLDDREARAVLHQVEARERYWQEELARQQALEARGVASRATYERTQSEYLQAKAATAAARQRLEDFNVRAPIAGTVLRQDGEVGEVVDKQKILFSIGQPKPLRVTADVDEEDIVHLVPGQKALIKADAFSDRTLSGTVAAITPKGDPINKSFRVRVALPPDTPVLVGMTVEINVVTRETPDAILIPAGTTRDGHVFVAEADRARRVPVKIGARGAAQTEIVEGLAADSLVILEPPAKLTDGARIRIANGAKAHPR